MYAASNMLYNIALCSIAFSSPATYWHSYTVQRWYVANYGLDPHYTGRIYAVSDMLHKHSALCSIILSSSAKHADTLLKLLCKDIS
jgi:hypothetical protein